MQDGLAKANDNQEMLNCSMNNATVRKEGLNLTEKQSLSETNQMWLGFSIFSNNFRKDLIKSGFV